MTHHLRSTPDNITWGGFPIDSAPRLEIESGDEVRIDTLSHEGATDANMPPEKFFAPFGIRPDEILPDVKGFWGSIPDRVRYGSRHLMTGPIYVEGAEPGDTLEIEVLDITTRVPYGVNNTGPTSGVFSTAYPGWREGDQPLDITAVIPPDAPGGTIPDVRRHVYRTGEYRGREVAFFSDEVKIPLQPFMGIMAVAPKTGEFVGNTPDAPPPADGVQSSRPPGPFGGNLDFSALTAGSTLYLPVFQDGAQFFTGDPHSLQGGGEVSGTAIEHSLSGAFRFILHKGVEIDAPWAEDQTHWYLMGINHDLDRAMRFAAQATVDFLVEEKGLTVPKAYSLASLAVDYVNAEVVDATQVVVGKIAKSLFDHHDLHPA